MCSQLTNYTLSFNIAPLCYLASEVPDIGNKLIELETQLR